MSKMKIRKQLKRFLAGEDSVLDPGDAGPLADAIMENIPAFKALEDAE